MKSYIPLIFFVILSISLSTFGQNSGDTLAAHNLGFLTPTPDRGLTGIEFANGNWWVTGFDPDDNYQHKLYTFSADGETLLSTYEYGLEFAGWKGLASDGVFLYVADIDTIRQIDMTTGEKTGVKIPGPFYYQNGLAYDADQDIFWVSGDGNVIYAIDRNGAIVTSAGFINDLPISGLAWDNQTPYGPYLWIWSMKYTPEDVRPQAYQMHLYNGTLTGQTFEGVNMHPDGALGSDYSLGATISTDVIAGKTVFAALHGSSYLQSNDQLDWLVLYDINTFDTPGPEIAVSPQSIQNDLLPGDSMDIELVISNLNDEYALNWKAQAEYPNPTGATPGELLLSFDASVLYPDTNARSRGLVWSDNAYWISTSVFFDDQFRLYKISGDGNTLLETRKFYSAGAGWRSIASYENKIYGADTYTITEYDVVSSSITGNYPKSSFSADALAYDPYEEHFFMGNGNGAIREINKEGDEINFFVVPWDIEGLAWDSWSPGGPYLWALTKEAEGFYFMRLDPQSGGLLEVRFAGENLSGDPDIDDSPQALFITPNWQENKLVAGALQKSFETTNEPRDRVAVYDLGTTPPPGWISIVGKRSATTPTLSTDTLMVRLHAIQEDTLVTATLVFNSNDVQNTEVEVPVNFRMLPQVSTGMAEELSQVTIHPNPVKDKLYINGNAIIGVSLFSLQGEQLMEINYTFNNIVTIPAASLESGIYILEVRNVEGTTLKKVVVL